MPAAISAEAVMAYAILTSTNADRPVLIEDVSSLFAKLRQEKIEEVGRVALRRIPRGLYSEDVEAFFGRLLAGGFAEARSPLNLNENGKQLCLEIINEESQSNPKAMRRVAQVLGFDLSLITNPAPQHRRA
jgi:hypothetical protein